MTQHNAATAADVSTKRVPRPTATGIRRCTGPGQSPHRTADTNATIRNAIREKEYQTRPRRHHHHRPRHLPRRRRRRRPRRRQLAFLLLAAAPGVPVADACALQTGMSVPVVMSVAIMVPVAARQAGGATTRMVSLALLIFRDQRLCLATTFPPNRAATRCTQREQVWPVSLLTRA